MPNTIMPYNGVYNSLTVSLNSANNGTGYTFFIDPDNVDNRTYIGYVRVIKADDVCYITLGNESNDQILMESGSWFNFPYHVGFNTIYVYNSASTVTNAKLVLLVTV